MALAMGGGGGGGGQRISEVLLGTLQIFENLYSARVMWTSPTYNAVCEMILHLQGHRDPSVSAAVVHVLPTCARYDFCAVYGVVSPRNDEVFLGCLDQRQWRSVSGCVFGSSPNLEPIAYSSGFVWLVVWALGSIAGAVNIEIKSYIEDVRKIVKEYLLKPGNPKAPASDKHLFGCIANLASAVGSHLLRQYNETLDLLLAGAFNERVTAALAVVVKEMALLLKSVQSESPVLSPRV